MPIEKTRKNENSKRSFIIIYRNFLTKKNLKDLVGKSYHGPQRKIFKKGQI